MDSLSTWPRVDRMLGPLDAVIPEALGDLGRRLGADAVVLSLGDRGTWSHPADAVGRTAGWLCRGRCDGVRSAGLAAALTAPVPLDPGSPGLLGAFWARDPPSALPGALGPLGERLAAALRCALRFEEVRERERHYRRIFHQVPVSIWEEDFSDLEAALDELRTRGITDIGGYLDEHPEFLRRAARLIRIVDVNDYTLKLYGARTREELLGSLHRVFTDESYPVFKGEVAALAEGAASFECEGANRTLSGERLEVMVRVEFPEGDRDVRHATVSITDITRRKAAEEALRRTHEDLERRVRERTAELEEAKRRLEADFAARERAEAERERLREELQRARILEAVGQLAGGVAHDFNNLLGSILGCLYVLRLGADAEARVELDRIQELCKRGGELTRQLLAVARRRGGKVGSVLLEGLLEEVRVLLERTLPKHIRLTVEAEGGLPPVRGDRSLLSVALLNLGLNARDAMPEGGHLRVRARAAGPGVVEVVVEDTGVGIPPEIRDRVFEPFFSTKPPGEGTGLGLSMVYATVEECGGSVSLRSGPGRGTTVVLRLPADRAVRETADGPLPEGPGRHPLTSAPVLVVEDEDDVARMIQGSLGRHGYRTLRARNGLEALEAVRDHREDLGGVLLDLVLPELGGDAVFRFLRSLVPDLPVLFITGREDRARGLDETTPVLAKPFSDADLLRALGELWGRGRVTRSGS